MKRVLNLYAGIGGNRKLWKDVDVVAVENDERIAKIYQDFFLDDKVIIADAHQYLLDHFKEFDFVWSSPPCPSHSKIRNEAGVGRGQNEPIYPDMKLYEEIILMQQMSKMKIFKGKYIIENVVGYYKPLISPQEIARHYLWSNFYINPYKTKTRGHMLTNKELMEIKGFKVNDRKLLRNCTEPELGLHIFQEAYREYKRLL